MISENEKLKIIFDCAEVYLKEICPVNDVSRYFIAEKFDTIEKIFERLCKSLQNRNSWSNIINYEKNETTLRKILKNFEPREIVKFYDKEKLFSIFQDNFQINNADSTKNSWYQYAGFVLSASRFMSRFDDAEQFDEFINNFSKDELTRAALPMLLAKEIDGIGFALACDFLKESGYLEYPKPDSHLNDIFSELNICPNKQYDVYKAIIRMAEACKKTPFHIDKVFWLISSGNYYWDMDEKTGKKCKVPGKKDEFISRANKKIKENEDK